MKTLLILALTFTGIALSTPEAQARDRHRNYCDDSRGYSRPSYSYSYYRSDYAPSYRYSRTYYSPAPRYYYRPARSYHYSERCEPERRRSHRSLISFVFGF